MWKRKLKMDYTLLLAKKSWAELVVGRGVKFFYVQKVEIF